MRQFTFEFADIVVALRVGVELSEPPRTVAVDLQVSSYRGWESGVPDPADQPADERGVSIPEATTEGSVITIIYDRMRELADEHLTRPVTFTIDTYEDGTFRIQAKHHIPPDGEETLYYHSEKETVRYAVMVNGGMKDEKIIAELPVRDT
jgi:hypothetical protein